MNKCNIFKFQFYLFNNIIPILLFILIVIHNVKVNNITTITIY
jgi:hypothetical protein